MELYDYVYEMHLFKPLAAELYYNLLTTPPFKVQ